MESPIEDPNAAAMLAQFLAGRDAECPKCQYNLRDLTSGRCPECGEWLKLQVDLVQSRVGAWVSIVAVCCLGIGSSAFLVLLALAYGPQGWLLKHSGGQLTLGELALSSMALATVLINRRSIRRKSNRFQWALAGILAAAMGGLTAAMLACFDG